MQYSIDGSLLQELLNYLAQRPYSEVVNLINGIQQSAKPIEENTDGGE